MTVTSHPLIRQRLRIAVLGYIVRCPLGGMAWHHLQYVAGLRALGHEVCFLEDSGNEPWACYDPISSTNSSEPKYGLQFASNAFDRLGLDRMWAYYDAFTNEWHGPMSSSVFEFLSSSDLLLNLSGANELRSWTQQIPLRAYVDTDPVFTQVRNLADQERLSRTAMHNAFFTFGENVMTGNCEIPDDGFPWIPTRQPVFLDAWPVERTPRKACFSTVMQWDNSIQGVPTSFNGRDYRRKSFSFEPYMTIPRKSRDCFEIAIGGSAPFERLKAAGWRIRDPLQVTRDLFTYQQFIRDSAAEFSVAKEGYVSSRCGWFSERSAAYLASGRPVVVQDTGFTDWIPYDRGALAFSSPVEALERLNEVGSNYDIHARAAREIAEEYFDSSIVLNSLLDRALSPA